MKIIAFIPFLLLLLPIHSAQAHELLKLCRDPELPLQNPAYEQGYTQEYQDYLVNSPTLYITVWLDRNLEGNLQYVDLVELPSRVLDQQRGYQLTHYCKSVPIERLTFESDAYYKIYWFLNRGRAVAHANAVIYGERPNRQLHISSTSASVAYRHREAVGNFEVVGLFRGGGLIRYEVLFDAGSGNHSR